MYKNYLISWEKNDWLKNGTTSFHEMYLPWISLRMTHKWMCDLPRYKAWKLSILLFCSTNSPSQSLHHFHHTYIHSLSQSVRSENQFHLEQTNECRVNQPPPWPSYDFSCKDNGQLNPSMLDIHHHCTGDETFKARGKWLNRFISWMLLVLFCFIWDF